MVGLDDLPNAVGLNSATFNLTRIGGPALGALVIDVAERGRLFCLERAFLPGRHRRSAGHAPGRALRRPAGGPCPGPGPRGPQVHPPDAAAAPGAGCCWPWWALSPSTSTPCCRCWPRSTSRATPPLTPSCSSPWAWARWPARSRRPATVAPGCGWWSGRRWPWAPSMLVAAAARSLALEVAVLVAAGLLLPAVPVDDQLHLPAGQRARDAGPGHGRLLGHLHRFDAGGGVAHRPGRPGARGTLGLRGRGRCPLWSPRPCWAWCSGAARTALLPRSRLARRRGAGTGAGV